MTSHPNFDRQEIEKFDRVAQIWWDLNGEMRTLHTINPLRTKFILDPIHVESPRILDVGCGGGILAEALAREGARVMGIDLSRDTILAAREHARAEGLEIDYRIESVEEVVNPHAGRFDAVTCMEMLEHVPDPAGIVAACAQALKPGGHAFFSTINRTLKAFLFAIVAGEYFLRLLPRGTHQYRKLIQPQEIKDWGRKNGLSFSRISSLMYNPITGRFKAAPGKGDVNYMVHLIKE